ncbi:MAG: WYL domain-containing protein [Bacteroidota bacterium]
MENDEKKLFLKYIGLLEFIIKNEGCDFNTIQNSSKIQGIYGGKIAERTLFRHRKEIEKSFGIKIHCRRKMYFVDEKDITKIESNHFYDWLKQSFTLSDIITQNLSLNHRILLDISPAGQNLLPIFVEAMRNNLKVKIIYHQFVKDPYEKTIIPLVLKVFKQRWYVLGESDDIKLYSLGRMDACELTDEPFKLKPNFDPEKYFSFTYGVTLFDEKQKPSTIKIKAGYQRYYLRELPLHESQEETELGNESIFTYFLKPSNEFIMELLSYGDGVEVLEPESLRNEIKSRIERMNKKYN